MVVLQSTFNFAVFLFPIDRTDCLLEFQNNKFFRNNPYQVTIFIYMHSVLKLMGNISQFNIQLFKA